MKKVLEVVYPPITSYMTHASILSVVMKEEQGINWLLGNYLQLSVVDVGGIDFFALEPPLNCPVLHYQIMDHELVDHVFQDPVQFVIHAIDQDYYLFVLLDTSRIKAVNASWPRPHPVFIYGYCEESETFHIGEFFNGNRFEFLKISFEEFRSSWTSYYGHDYWFKGNRLFKYAHKEDYILDYERVITFIDDYVNSQNTMLGFHNFNRHLSFGLDAVAARLKLELARLGSGERFDWVAFPIICDHKEVMQLAIQQLEKKGYLDKNASYSEGFRHLKQELLILKNLYLKIIFSEQPGQLQLLQLKVSRWFEQEKEFLMKMIEHCRAKTIEC